MALPVMTSKLLAAAAGMAAGYLLYKPEAKKSGSNSGDNNKGGNNSNVYIPSAEQVLTVTSVVQREENPYVFGSVNEPVIDDPRVKSAWYFGNKNKPYDPFYDYTDFYQRAEIDHLAASNPMSILRARILPEFCAVTKRYVGTIGEGVIANGYCLDMRFRVEVFNPSAYAIPINKLGIQSVQYNNEKMFCVRPNWTCDVARLVGNNKNNNFLSFLYFDNFGKQLVVDYYTDSYKNYPVTYCVWDDYDPDDEEIKAKINLSVLNKNSNFSFPYDRKVKTPLLLNALNWLPTVEGITKSIWNFFEYPGYTPETVPAQGSFFQDYFLIDLYSRSSVLDFEDGWPFIFHPKIPAASQPSLLVGLTFGNEKTGDEGTLYAGLYVGDKPVEAPMENKYNYMPESAGSFTGVLDPKDMGIVDLWLTLKENYGDSFSSCFGVDMAAYWYLWACNKAGLEDEMAKILGMSIGEFDRRALGIKLQILEQKLSEDKKKRFSELYGLWQRAFRNTDLSVATAKKTYEAAYAKAVMNPTLMKSLEYWSKAAGAAPATTTTMSGVSRSSSGASSDNVVMDAGSI